MFLTAGHSTQIPFRETHHIAGRAVALAESRQCQLNDLKISDFEGLSKMFSEDIYDVFDFETSVERRSSIGGTSRQMVERQISILRQALADK
jgi:argininosuccinate lyase